MLPLKTLEAASSMAMIDLSEFLGEIATLSIIQNMERMNFDELVEFKRSLEIISEKIQMETVN